MKFSKAMLKGFEKVNGRQCKEFYCKGSALAPEAVCVLGAFHLGDHGRADTRNMFDVIRQDAHARRFYEAWGSYPQDLNDSGMPWEHIYGMAVAAGL